jgi:hypothetical protein
MSPTSWPAMGPSGDQRSFVEDATGPPSVPTTGTPWNSTRAFAENVESPARSGSQLEPERRYTPFEVAARSTPRPTPSARSPRAQRRLGDEGAAPRLT